MTVLVGAGLVPIIGRPPLGLPTYIMHEVTAVGISGTKTVNVPTGTANGHVMIANMSLATTVEPQVATFEGQGWNTITTVNPGGAAILRVYWKVASSEPASYSIQWNASTPTSVLSITTFSGVSVVNPVDGTPSSGTATSATLTSASLNTSNDNTMLIQFSHTTGTRTYSSSTLNEIIDVNNAPGLGVFYGLQSFKGASGAKTATISSSASYGQIMVALRPRNGV